ncbi:MAG: Phospho-N-acetylmuramoyl-pentapeptide-transferase [uncultured Thermomicrobiales bacterium]|uniref:Phospho-N-acetylmuramoyl-pentapeptide-transferase n=1 Tax=uncultured Thermomicrobiales bacterium TaxID=1645740 RepID=A0A6J4VEA4_9BACT|nr:MAG: Phospho-N-acetylmuramoyl-pentapeptide-transferase [uncultured Thermomicrobiales bacterium]
MTIDLFPGALSGFPPVPNLAQASLLPTDAGNNMAASLGLSGLAFVLTLLMGRPILNYLRQRKFGKQVRADGPTTHLVKTGTPTMGGVIFLVPIVILTGLFNVYGRLSMLLLIGVLVAAAILGALDDRQSFIGSAKGGMTARIKMVWLVVFGLVAALILHLPDPYGLGLQDIYVPFLGQFDIGWLYVPIAMVAIIGFANAVNLTDGLDTLAAGTAAVAFCSYGIIAFVQGQVGVVAFCFTIVGALMGFLWFNAFPAQVFMGDVGSLALGAALATAAFMTGQWLLLPIVGFVFVCEAVSVILQVGYFKLTKGRRLFKMTPLHHHFEVIGWSETQVAMRFWMVGMICGLLGVALALL